MTPEERKVLQLAAAAPHGFASKVLRDAGFWDPGQCDEAQSDEARAWRVKVDVKTIETYAETFVVIASSEDEAMEIAEGKAVDASSDTYDAVATSAVEVDQGEVEA